MGKIVGLIVETETVETETVETVEEIEAAEVEEQEEKPAPKPNTKKKSGK